MILRRVIEYVKTQHWTAIVIDFVIVVAGVFIGIPAAGPEPLRPPGRHSVDLSDLEPNTGLEIPIRERCA